MTYIILTWVLRGQRVFNHDMSAYRNIRSTAGPELRSTRAVIVRCAPEQLSVFITAPRGDQCTATAG